MPARRPPLLFIYTVTLTGIMNNTLVTPAIPDILAEFQAPEQSSGLLVASGSLAGIIIAPLTGFLADRYGRRIVLTVCLTIFGVFGLANALSPTFDFLLLTRFLQGAGAAGLINLSMVLIGDHWSGADRTRLVGRNSSVLTVGLVLLPVLAGAVTQVAGWRVAFGLYTVSLVTAVIAYYVLDPWRPAAASAPLEQMRAAGDVIRRPEIVTILALGTLVFVIIFGLYLTVFPLHLAQRFGMEAGPRGVMISVPAVTTTLIAFNLGRIRAMMSLRTMVLVSSVGFTIGFFLIGFSSVLMIVVFGALIYGASEGAFIPGIQDEAMAISPNEHRGSVMAVWVGASRLGQTAGPLLAGAALTIWSPSATLMVGSGLGLVMLAVAAVGSVSRLRNSEGSPRRG